MKKIYLEPMWRMHSLSKMLLSHPPEGYEFITPEGVVAKASEPLGRSALAQSLYHQVCRLIPVNLVKPYLGRFKRIPKDVDLTYSITHLIFKKDPWVLDLDSEPAIALAGRSKHLKRYKGLVERTLASDYCQKILCQLDAVSKSLQSSLDCRRFEHKIEVIPYAVPKKEFTKNYNHDKVKLLFVNSENLPGAFEAKGGIEVLEAFSHLNEKYDNLELVVRSDMPRDIESKYQHLENVRFFKQVIPWEKLEQEFKSADIFILPAHMTPAMVFLDAMSYELPIITTDLWGNSEMVADGKTGFLVNPSESDPYYLDKWTPAYGETGIKKMLRQTDPNVVNELAEKVSILIENPELRRKMGEAARWEVEKGRFSIEKRNQKLKKIFDEATS